MVKLVVTDLDGTLLDGAGKLPADTVRVFETLRERGIRIVVASGRPYASIRELFGDFTDKLGVICENGGMTYLDGTLMDKKPISDHLLRQALHKVRMVNYNYPVLCGVKHAYIEDTDPDFFSEVSKYYFGAELVENLDDVIGTDDICKISVYDAIGAADNGYPALKAISRGLRAVLSGGVWTDICVSTSNKSTALSFVMEYYGLSADNVMAFGDYYNDVDMLKLAGESYAMANAPAEVKEACRHVAPANTENGVLRILRCLVKG